MSSTAGRRLPQQRCMLALGFHYIRFGKVT
jgi:hypothetical protein